MAQLPVMFDATQYDPAQISQQLPVSPAEGWPVIIAASEFKATANDANAGYLDLTLQIIDGENKGTEGHYRINLFHSNPKTVEIANKQLSALCHVCNQFRIADSAQLHNIPFRAVVSLQKKKEADAPDYTEVKGVKDIYGNDPGKQGAAPAAAAPQAPVAPPVQQPVAPAAATAPPAWGAPPAAPAPVAEAPPAWGAAPQTPAPAAPPVAAAPPWATKPA